MQIGTASPAFPLTNLFAMPLQAEPVPQSASVLQVFPQNGLSLKSGVSPFAQVSGFAPPSNPASPASATTVAAVKAF